MTNIKQELDKIKERISDPKFLTNKGQSNEVGIHVFCYDPVDELLIRDYIDKLVNTPSDVYRIIERDLYKLFLEILADKRILDRIADMEEKRGAEHILNHFHKTVSERKNEQSYYDLMKKMDYAPHKQGDILVLTGIGKAYPFIRAHIILNAMQKMFADIPVLVFYPGEYNGQTLNLFNKFHDGNYYRAFNLI